MEGVHIQSDPTIYTNARLKVYPGKTVMQVATAPIFPLNKGSPGERGYDVSPPGSAKDHDRALAESQRRACSKVRDIALCNHFEYFFTWTLDPALIDRYDPNIVYRKVRVFLSNAVQRQGFAYVLVPEYHTIKDGENRPAIHMHGLSCLGDVPIERAVSPSGHELSDNHGRPIYNMPSWKYGFSTCVPLDQQYERTVNYVTKYITKSDCKIFGKWYLSSRGLKKAPDLIPLAPIQYDHFRDSEKLKMHIQNEHQLYPDGPHMITEEMPPLRGNT